MGNLSLAGWAQNIQNNAGKLSLGLQKVHFLPLRRSKYKTKISRGYPRPIKHAITYSMQASHVNHVNTSSTYKLGFMTGLDREFESAILDVQHDLED